VYLSFSPLHCHAHSRPAKFSVFSFRFTTTLAPQIATLSGSVSALKRLVESHLREKEQAAELLKGYVTTITREVRARFQMELPRQRPVFEPPPRKSLALLVRRDHQFFRELYPSPNPRKGKV